MEGGALLHVITCTLAPDTDIGEVLRALRRMQPKAAQLPQTLLLLADLGNAPASELPTDAPLLRSLQSGVMAINARSESAFGLLVRKRVWDDAQRAYVSAGEKMEVRRTIARLIAGRPPEIAFAAATLSPSALQDRFAFVLFSSLSLACTPGTPARMRRALGNSPCVSARVISPRSYPQTALARLCAVSPFSLSPLLAAREDRLLRRGLGAPDAPVLYRAETLTTQSLPQEVPLAADCCFVRRAPPDVGAFFSDWRRFCLHAGALHALLPLFQLLLLFLAAALGWPVLAALAVLPAEGWALLHPRLLPGALVRLALLPLTALVSLDALLCRAFAHAKLLRLRVPDPLVTAQGCALFGAMLLPAALYGAQALAMLLPVGLLWLTAPLILTALDMPTLERIPLSGDEAAQLRALSESAFFDSERKDASPSLRMLRACAGCLLGLLEPDEAARQAAQLLPKTPLPPSDLAALLASAQILREHMGSCDASLRDLPARIEARALSLPLLPTGGALSALLLAAHGGRPASCGKANPLDALFLPLGPVRETPRCALTLPVTHPHTFLKHQLLTQDSVPPEPLSVEHFLSLADAALGHPFAALLSRSPVAGPYWPLLSM